MTKHAHHPTAARLVLGLGLMALGAAFLLRNLLGAQPVPAFQFWPLCLLLLALGSFVRRGGRHLAGHVLLLAALALQLKGMGHQDLLSRWWPVALVWLGLVKVLHSLGRPHRLQGPDAVGSRS
jgi:hypothetical protein